MAELVNRIREAYRVETESHSVILYDPQTGERIFVSPNGKRRISLPKVGWEGTEEELARLLLGEEERRRRAWRAEWGDWDAQAVLILQRAKGEAGGISRNVPVGEIALEEGKGELDDFTEWVAGRTADGARVLEFRYSDENGVSRFRYRVRSSVPQDAMPEVAKAIRDVADIRVGIMLGSGPVRSCRFCNRAFHIAEGAEVFAIARLRGWSRKICPACRQGLAFALRKPEGIWIPGAFLAEDGSLRPGPLPPHPEAAFLIGDGEYGVWGGSSYAGIRFLVLELEEGVKVLELPEPTPPPQMSPDRWIRAGRFQISPCGEVKGDEAPLFVWVAGPKGVPVEAEVSPEAWRLWDSKYGEIRWSTTGWLEVLPKRGTSFITSADGAMVDASGNWIALMRWPPEARWGDLQGISGQTPLPADPVEAAAFPLLGDWLLLLGSEAFLLRSDGSVRRFPFPRAFARAWEIPEGGRVLSGPGGTFVVFREETRFFPEPVTPQGVAVALGRAAVLLRGGALFEVIPNRIRSLGEGFQAVAGSGSFLAALDHQGRFRRFPPAGGQETIALPIRPEEAPELNLAGLGRGMFLVYLPLRGRGWVLRGDRLDPVWVSMIFPPEFKEVDNGIVLETLSGPLFFPDDPRADPVRIA